MEAREKRGMGLKKAALISVLIFSTLAIKASTLGDEFRNIVDHSENLTVVYVLGGLFVGCILIYLIGKYFSGKEHPVRHSVKPPQQRVSRQRVIRKTP